MVEDYIEINFFEEVVFFVNKLYKVIFLMGQENCIGYGLKLFKNF